MANTSSSRCAVYTRKSSEEGLEQDFNSLQAQREACEAFIRSQAGEGWRLIRTAYDDGGLSGGTMERPALRQLLADIGAGLVDIVVVYKVDRLTRSLADFAKMVELFDAHRVSFVAVTQQFNTTTSMGRLTLNVLLSFAQFEREVTGERIRDKIAASKKKGMWMGGIPPLGYDVHERRLVVNPEEAETVRCIYRRYLELGSVRELSRDLAGRGIVSKIRVSQKGIESGGCRFSRGALYELLSNPLHIGEIRHRQERYPGQHEAIVPRELWEAVQQHLRTNAVRGRQPATKAIASPLAGKVFDTDGEPLYALGAVKAGRRYRYYVSRGLVNGSTGDERKGWRLAAPELERAVAIAAQQILRDRAGMLEVIGRSQLKSPDIRGTIDSASVFCRRLQDEADARSCMAEIIDRIELCDDGIRVTLKLTVPCSQAGVQTNTIVGFTGFVPLVLKRRGVETRLVITGGTEPPRTVDPALLKAVSRARAWFDELVSGRARSLAEIARREGITRRYVERLARLAFVVPAIVEAICRGQQSPELSTETLLKRINLPLAWPEQRDALGIN